MKRKVVTAFLMAALGSSLVFSQAAMAAGTADKTENTAKIDVNIIVEYGSRIPDVAFEIQNRVKKSVESMTGFKVEEVNVHVQGVDTNISKSENTDNQKETNENEGEK